MPYTTWESTNKRKDGWKCFKEIRFKKGVAVTAKIKWWTQQIVCQSNHALQIRKCRQWEDITVEQKPILHHLSVILYKKKWCIRMKQPLCHIFSQATQKWSIIICINYKIIIRIQFPMKWNNAAFNKTVVAKLFFVYAWRNIPSSHSLNETFNNPLTNRVNGLLFIYL